MKKHLSSLNNLSQSKWLLIIALLLAYILPLSISLYNTIVGNIAFWYDPARDLLAAWDNLHKITLIGPTSGIPGIFYGPYWIWFLSLGLVISKNPRFVNFFVELLPYYTLFPFVLFQFAKLFGKKTVLILWLLFILGIGFNYTIMMWNPHPAPILFLLYIFLLTFIPQKQNARYFLHILSAGITLGLLLNFHISFGLGVLGGTVIFFVYKTLLSFYKNKSKPIEILKEILYATLIFIGGLFIVFIPSIFFEIRHNFQQTKALIETLSKYGGVVGLKGLSNRDILLSFFERNVTVFFIPKILDVILGIVEVLGIIFILLKKKVTEKEKNLIILLVVTSISILTIFLTAKNPVWEYHFIGVEIIFLLVIGILISKFSLLRNILVVYSLAIILFKGYDFYQTALQDPYTIPNLVTKEHVTKIVINDARNTKYTVFVYNASIYTFDYSYLFQWLGEKSVPYDPGRITNKNNTVYLIFPKTRQPLIDDFIEYRTASKLYKTVKTWHIADGTTILKRVKTTSSSI